MVWSWGDWKGVTALNEATYARLTAPFADTYERKGFTYIKGSQVASRLNDVLGVTGWSFVVKEHGYSQQADSYWVLGQITARIDGSDVVREQFGSQALNRFRAAAPGQSGKIVDVGNDMKGAATDAFKKCAAQLGVGLYLAGPTHED